MGSVRRRRTLAALAAGGLAAGLALAGCGGGADSGTSSNVAEPMTASGGDVARDQAQSDGGGGAPNQEKAAAEAPAAGAPNQAQAGAGDVDLAVDQRQIIYTGSIMVRVENVERTAAEITSLVAGAGGFIGGDKRTDDGGRSEAVLTLRVPAPRFTSVVDEIAKKGTDDRREISTQDVTEEVVDLDARITTQRARVESARRLLGQAKTINDLVSLENELGRREADLASLEGKKRRLSDLTALSTITATLLGPEAQAPPPPPDDDNTGFLAGLRGGWDAFTATLGVALTVLGALVPWLVLAGLGLLVFVYVRRRRPRPAAALAGPAIPTQATAAEETEKI
ncbi:DUF4349 domain-containing protein [Asanoa sp. NPDC049518]|uniref:DUF4349 domain-containing protein n=1 Tax=unclassified Asanoa TaxID=2685164 RepID=UPI003445E932